MSASTELALTNKEKALEILLALAKGGISFFPGGGLVTEVCGVLMPDKQEERIMRMLIHLREKIEDMEKSKVQERLREPEVQELFHDCNYEAARTSAKDKLKAIANILASGISSNSNTFRARQFLSLLNQLDEIDLIILLAINNIAKSPDAPKQKGFNSSVPHFKVSAKQLIYPVMALETNDWSGDLDTVPLITKLSLDKSINKLIDEKIIQRNEHALTIDILDPISATLYATDILGDALLEFVE